MMTESDAKPELSKKIVAALARHGLKDVQCEMTEKGLRLVGHVQSDEDRSIAFALARTTAGTTALSNGIEVRKPL